MTGVSNSFLEVLGGRGCALWKPVVSRPTSRRIRKHSRVPIPGSAECRSEEDGPTAWLYNQ